MNSTQSSLPGADDLRGLLMRHTTRTILLRYGGAVTCVALAVFLRWLLAPWLGNDLPFSTLYGAVAFAVWFGGYRPAILAAVLGFLACQFLFVEPRGTLARDNARNLLGLLTYLLSCAIIVGFGEAMQSAHRRLRARQRELEEAVGQRRYVEKELQQRKEDNDVERLGSDEALRQRAEEMEKLMDVLPLGVFIAHDPACHRITGNRAAYEMLRLPVGSNLSATPPSGEAPPFTARRNGRPLAPGELPIQYAAAHAVEVRDVEVEFAYPDGTTCTLFGSAAPLFDRQGKVRGCVASFLDITARKQAEETLRSFYDTAPMMMGVVEVTEDDVLHLTDNAATGQFFGIDPARLAHRRASELEVPPDHRREWIRHYRESERIGQPVRFDYLHETPGGNRWVSAIVFCMERLPDGRSRCSYVAEDVTERKRVEDALRDAERRWRTMTEALPNLVWTDLPDGQCDWLSSQWGKYTGIPEKELLGLNWLEQVIHPDDRDRTLACWQAACADQGNYDLEYRIRRHDGEYRWFKTRGVPVRDDGGKIVYWFGTCTDIEDHKRAEEALRRSEAQFRQLADAMPQIVWTARPDGNIDYLNRRWVEFTGLPQTAGNDGWGQILHPEDTRPASERWAACLRSSTPFEMEIRLLDRRQRTYRWHLIRTVPVQGEEGAVLRWYGTSTDIHEQKWAGQVARFLADASASLAAVVDYESTLQRVAALAVPFFADWSAVDMATEDGTLRRLAVVHQDSEKVQLAQELVRRYPHDLKAPGGIGCVFRTRQPEFVAELTDAMLVQGAKNEDHLRLMRALGLRSYICVPLVVSDRAFGVLTFATAESGRSYTGADLSVAQDLAHRAAVAVENARLYRELRDADRRKDEFLAILAHELRNPLAPLRNGLQIIRLAGNERVAVEQARTMMERQLEHFIRLVDDLLDLSRISRGKIVLHKERALLADVLNNTVESCDPLIKQSGHQLTLTLPDEPVYVDADRTRLAQALGNLLTNAAKYSERGSQIWLTAERQGSDVVVSVKDTGIGIAEAMLPRVFEMFTQVDRSLERSQGGLGIGLSIVKRLVEMHGGSVAARSEGPGMGSEFIVRLPVVLALVHGQEPRRDGDPQQGRPRTRHRILVVDDNVDIAESLAMMLTLMGNEVRTAHDGLEGVAAAAAYRPELILLDIGMPKLNGYDACRRIREQPWGKGILIVAITGWSQDEDRRRSLEAGFNYHLVKPVGPDALEKLLEELKTKTA